MEMMREQEQKSEAIAPLDAAMFFTSHIIKRVEKTKLQTDSLKVEPWT